MQISSYTKFKKTFPDGTIIYIDDSCMEFDYPERNYERLKDSLGNEHSVQVSYEMCTYKFDENDFELKVLNGGVNILKHNHFEFEYAKFQFNLNKYILIIPSYCSCYQCVQGFIEKDLRGLWTDKYTHPPEYFHEHHWKFQDAMKSIGYRPLRELCFVSGNHYDITNYISDRTFFNYPDRKIALERLDFHSRELFNDVDYINMNDIELVKFLNDRFKRRLQLESFIEDHKYLFTNNN